MSFFDFLETVFITGIWLVFWVGPIAVFLWLGYQAVSLRMRRRERARFFLDLVDISVKQGRRIEETIIAVSDARETSLGVHFHILAYYLKDGVPLGEALSKVPRLLPPQAAEMLRAGLRIGDVSKVLPACRQVTRDAVSQTRGGINYLVAVLFVGVPVNILLLTLIFARVVPQFGAVASDMETTVPTGLMWIYRLKGTILLVQGILFLVVWFLVAIYLDGPRLFSWSERMFGSLAHRVIFAVPWRRKRFQRDFATMLAVLIDAGMPEAEAVTLAAECTANRVFRERAQRAVAELRSGMKLPEAIATVDDTGEFHWRLKNAMQTGGEFFKAIAGWKEALDAKAYQLEQAATQAFTASLVLINGIVVGFVVISLFSILIGILNGGLLW